MVPGFNELIVWFVPCKKSPAVKKLKNFSPFSLVSTEVSEGIDWISEMITMLYTLNYSILCNVEDDLWIVDVSLDIVLLYKRLYAVIKVCDGQGES